MLSSFIMSMSTIFLTCEFEVTLLFSKLKALLYIEEVAATLELAQYSLDQVIFNIKNIYV